MYNLSLFIEYKLLNTSQLKSLEKFLIIKAHPYEIVYEFRGNNLQTQKCLILPGEAYFQS